MKKIIIAIISCARDINNGFNEAIRDTWLKSASVNYKFVLGRGVNNTKQDELILDCNDDYNSLPEKTLALIKWAISMEYDYVFKCDTDTYIVLDRLLSSNFFLFDYVGRFNGPIGIANVIYRSCYSWASGGSGYWLSNRAARFILEQVIDEKSICPILKIPCEDLWIGQVLGSKIKDGFFTAFDDSRYGISYNADYKTEISSHYCSQGKKRKFNTNWMYEHHKINQKK